MLSLPAVLADLRATRRFPTDAEAELIAREGSAAEVAEVMNLGCALHPCLRKRYAKDRRELLNQSVIQEKP